MSDSSGSWSFRPSSPLRLPHLKCLLLLLGVGLLSSLGSGRWVLGSWMSDSSGSYGWFVEQVGVGHLGNLDARFFTRSWG